MILSRLISDLPNYVTCFCEIIIHCRVYVFKYAIKGKTKRYYRCINIVRFLFFFSTIIFIVGALYFLFLNTTIACHCQTNYNILVYLQFWHLGSIIVLVFLTPCLPHVGRDGKGFHGYSLHVFTASHNSGRWLPVFLITNVICTLNE